MSRGSTLVEVLTAAAIMAGITLIVVLVHSQGLRVQKSQAADQEAYRSAMLAVRSLRQELRGAILLEPADLTGVPVQRLAYRPMMPDAGPSWADAVEVVLTEDGWLQRVDSEGGARGLVYLGEESSVSFRRAAARVLEVTIVSTREGAVYEARHSLALVNQP
ncbi:MAG: hypothetical protein HY319_26820 [Armatimonadetes bacterium]|nr:hypothetical protein [Armatimonadota bacterium]